MEHGGTPRARLYSKAVFGALAGAYLRSLVTAACVVGTLLACTRLSGKFFRKLRWGRERPKVTRKLRCRGRSDLLPPTLINGTRGARIRARSLCGHASFCTLHAATAGVVARAAMACMMVVVNFVSIGHRSLVIGHPDMLCKCCTLRNFCESFAKFAVLLCERKKGKLR